MKQADYECGVICQMQFCGYFLVVADYIQWAKDHGIMVGPGRGSAQAPWSPIPWALPSSIRSSMA